MVNAMPPLIVEPNEITPGVLSYTIVAAGV
jgi:hypothetical protein